MNYRVISNTNNFVIADFEFYSDARAFAGRWNDLFSHDPHLTQERYAVVNIGTDEKEIPYIDNVCVSV